MPPQLRELTMSSIGITLMPRRERRDYALLLALLMMMLRYYGILALL